MLRLLSGVLLRRRRDQERAESNWVDPYTGKTRAGAALCDRRSTMDARPHNEPKPSTRPRSLPRQREGIGISSLSITGRSHASLTEADSLGWFGLVEGRLLRSRSS